MKFKSVIASAAVLSVFALAACGSNADVDNDRLSNNITRSTTYATARPSTQMNTSAPITGYGYGTDSSQDVNNFRTDATRANDYGTTDYRTGLTNNIVRNDTATRNTRTNTNTNRTNLTNSAVRNNRLYNTDNSDFDFDTDLNTQTTEFRTQDNLYRRNLTNDNTDFNTNTTANTTNLTNQVNRTGLQNRTNLQNRPTGITPLTNTNTTTNTRTNTRTNNTGLTNTRTNNTANNNAYRNTTNTNATNRGITGTDFLTY